MSLRLLGYAGIGLALVGFVLWSAQIWGEFAGDGYWKLLGVLTAWSLAVLLVTTNRLMLSSPSLVRSPVPGDRCSGRESPRSSSP